MSPLRRGGGVMPTEEDEPGSSQRHDFEFPDWLKLELSSPRSSPAPAPAVVETPRLLVVDDYDASPRTWSRSFPLLAIPQPPPEIISSSLSPWPRSFSIAGCKKAKRESSFGPSTTPGSTSAVNRVISRGETSARLNNSPGSILIGGFNEVKKENSSSPSTSPGCIPIVGLSGAKRNFSSSPSSSPSEIPYVGRNTVMEEISSSPSISPGSISIGGLNEVKIENSLNPSTSPGSIPIVGLSGPKRKFSTSLSTSPGSIPIGGLHEVKKENSSNPSSSPGCIPIVGLSGAKKEFSTSPSSSPGEIPYVGRNSVMEEISSSPSTSPGSIPIGVLNEAKKEYSLSPSTLPGCIPIVGLSGPKRKFSSNPSSSPGASSVFILPKPSSILNSHLSTSPDGIPVDGLTGGKTKISSSSSTSPGSIPLVGLTSSRPWSRGHAAGIAALNRRNAMQELSSYGHISTSPDFMSVAEHIGMMKETPPKQVQAMEVTVLEPPPSMSNSVYKKKRKLERAKMHVHLADLLPDNILVIASRWRPPAQHEEELRKANSSQPRFKGNAGARKKSPPVPVGSVYNAIEEIYSERLDADAYAKYGLFHDRESVWFCKYSKGGPPPRPVAKERKPYEKATLVSRLKS